VKNKTVLFTLIILFELASLTQAEEASLGVDLTTFWGTKFIWNGGDYFENHAGILNTVNFDLYGTGFNAGLITAHAGSSGLVNKEGFGYYIKYRSSIFDDSPFKADYQLRWQYYDFYDNPSTLDVQEIRLHISFPELFSNKIIPTYHGKYLYTARGGGERAATEPEGFIHMFGLKYGMDTPLLSSRLDFKWDISYRDGWGGKKFDHDWSHTTFTVSTNIPFGQGILIPSLYYQISMEDTVNENNELYASLSYKIKF
jgi:hypothetical protein